jgi:uncharacterized peroxidase-related enzyme
LGGNWAIDPSTVDTQQEKQMSRISIPTRDQAPAQAQPLLDKFNERFGFVPNLPRLMSISPTVLAGVVGFQNALSGLLDAETRIAIAIAVSEINGCDYCLKSHCHVALNHHKIAPDEVDRNRRGDSYDPKRRAAAQFAAKVVEERGHVSDEELKAVREAGFVDAQILEIVALSVQYLMTNFMSNVARIEIDIELDDA